MPEVIERLLEYYTPAEVETWLNAPHPMLGGERAVDLVSNGRKDEVLRVITQMDEAVYV